MSIIYKRFLPSLIVFLISLSATYAQTGKIQGFVFDSQYNDPLPGANIYLEGTSIGAATDLNGKYVVSQVPAGDYKMVVKYIGYVDKVIDISVTANQTLEQVVTLDFESIEGEVIEVTAQAEGQMQAINQQLASDKIANIVSETKIQELPDFNAAAALSRLPGVSTTKSSGEDNKVVIRGLSPKYNSIEIEGVTLSATGSTNMGLTSDTYVYTPGVSNDRSVDLTGISPYMIRTIAVYKSLTPDMNANSIGGTVNMELREAPKGLKYDVLWQSGYTQKSNTYGNYRGVISASNRFFDDKLGIYGLANIESYDRDADNMDADYVQDGDIDSTTGFRPVRVKTVTFNRHLETRDRFGGNLIMDYRLPKGSIKFVNMFTRFNSDYTDHRQYILYTSGKREMRWRLQQGENIVDQQLHSLKLDYDLGFLTADLSGSYTASHNVLDNSPVLNFNQDNALGVKTDDEINKKPDQLTYLQTTFQGDSMVILRSGNLFSSDYEEDKLTFKADFELPFNIGTDISGYFKFGGQYHDQNNTNDQEAPYLGFDGSALPNSDQSISNDMMKAIKSKFGLANSTEGKFIGSSLINHDKDIFDAFLKDKFGSIHYAANPSLLNRILNYVVNNPDFDASNTDLSPGNTGGWYDGPYQQLTNDYEYEENYYAGYAMTKVNWMDFMVLGGIRYEKVKSDYFAYNARDVRNAQIQKMYDTTAVAQNEFVLPMTQVKYSPFNWMDVRYAYTQTLARPDYSQLTPKFTITQGNSIYSGNTDLKPAKAFNHDLNFTFHSNKLGLFTAGAFYKTIEGFVYTADYNLDAAQNAGFDLISNYQIIRDGVVVVAPANPQSITVHRPINNPNDAIVRGLELDFQHNFWYLPVPFNNIVFGINYTRISSELKYPYYITKPIPGTRPPKSTIDTLSSTGRLIDQPNHVLNTYVGYDYKGFSARLSVLFQDNTFRYFGGRYKETDSFTKEYYQIDFSARQKLPWFNSELFFDVANINNEQNKWYQRSIGGFQGIRNYGLTANLGIRIRY